LNNCNKMGGKNKEETKKEQTEEEKAYELE
jgi:hypothetical protein